MPRVVVKTKNKAGKRRSCGRCGAEIKPGERYRSWSFRYGGTHYRCSQPSCAPRRSELTQSLMGEVYAAIETAEDGLPNADTVADIREIIEAVAEAAESVMEQYREAAEPFGGAGENAERADELEGWVSDLQDFEPDEPDDEEYDEEAHADEIRDRSDEEGVSYSEAASGLREEYEQERAEALEAAIEAARQEAEDKLNECPL